MGWQDAPLVEEPKKGAARAAWEDAPLVDEKPTNTFATATEAAEAQRSGRLDPTRSVSVGGRVELPGAVTQAPNVEQMAKVETQRPRTFGERVEGALEAAAALGSGAITGPAGIAVGTVAGAIDHLRALMTGGKPTYPTVEQYATQAASAGIRQPQSEAGKEYTSAAMEPLASLPPVIGAGLGGGFKAPPRELLAAPVRAAVETVQQAAPSLRMAYAESKGPLAASLERVGQETAQAAKAAKTKLDQPTIEGIRAAREAGYVLTPSEARGGMLSTSAEGLAGEPKLAKGASKKNAETTNRLIREDIGLADDEPISRDALARVRKDAGEAYAEIKNQGEIANDKQYFDTLDSISKGYDTASKSFPHRSENPFQKTLDGLKQDTMDAASAVEEVKLLRNDADKAFKSGDKALGVAYRAMAEAVDNSIDRNLQLKAAATNSPELAGAIDRYRAARRTIAKTYLADAALNDTTGNIDAGVYARALKKGVPLDGNAASVARFAQQFPRLAQKVERLGSTGAPTIMDLFLTIGSHGKDLFMLGARPAMRAALLSDTVQKRLGPSGKAVKAAAREEPRLPPEPTLEQGFEPPSGPLRPPPEPSLGDLTPNWETAPGAAAERSMEMVSPEGLIPAIGEEAPLPQGIPQRPGSQIPLAENHPLGDLTPDWETTPGAARPSTGAGLSSEGLVPAVGDRSPSTGNRRGALDIPAVPGRPDLPDVMVAGSPAEVSASEATNAAMLSPETALARQQQGTAAAEAKAAVDPRLAKLDEAHGQAQSDAVRKVIAGQRKEVEKTIKAEQAEAKRTADIADLEKAAQATDDPGLKAALQKQADALRTEKIPVGEAKEITEPPATGRAPEGKKLPVGKATEVVEEPPTGRAPDLEPLPKGEATEVTRSGVEVQEKIPVGEAKELLPPKGGEHSDLNLPSIDEEFMRQEFNRKVEPKPNAPEPQVSDRGVQAVRKALEEARDAGTIDKDGASLALWAIDRNPGLAKGLKVSIETPHPDRLAKGSYNPAEEIVRIFKGFDNAHTATHEILHHSERMMPRKVQQGIQKEWQRALQEEMQKARGPVRELLSKIPAAAKGDKAAYEALIEGFKKGVLNREKHYQLVNPSEFWAVNAPRILSERFVGRGSWRAEAKQWIKEMIEHVKGTIGMRSDSPVLKALDEVLSPERNTGEKRSSKGLSPTPRSKS